jgi:mono/diheme cytochrome c family protein
MMAIASPMAANSGDERHVSGRVLSADQPVAGATVRIQATSHMTLTDARGEFVLALPNGRASVRLTGWAEGHYCAGPVEARAGEDGVLLRLERHTAVDHPDYRWLPAIGATEGACAECHSSHDDSRGIPFPLDQWLLDAHSRSAVNPRFLTMYAGTDVAGRSSEPTRFVEIRDYGRRPIPADEEERQAGPGYRLDFPDTAGNCAACHAPVAAANRPLETDPRTIEGVGVEGINCDFCHKLWSVRLDPATGLPYHDMPGVLSYELRRPGDGHQLFLGPFDDVPGEDARSDFYRRSEYCAGCHFGVFWDVVVYDSFGEWLRSPYSDPETGRSCQDCHMPPSGAEFFARPDRGGLRRDPEKIASHRMPGADDTTLLQNAVTMTVEADRFDSRVVVQVVVENDRTGHHVPTDSPLRQVILLVQAWNEEGAASRLASGPTLPSWTGDGDPARGRYSGLPGKVFARILEDGWTGERPTAAYWNPTTVHADTRIPALATDRSTFVFEAPPGESMTLRATLIYRRAFIDLMEAKGWDAPDIVMAKQELRVPPRPRGR